MRKVFIINHYATEMFFNHGGRHYYFAKYLLQKGYDVTIFCASTVHNSDKNIEITSGKCKTDAVDSIPYVFVKTPPYAGNGMKRIKNMVTFYRNLFPVTKKYAEKYGRPDVILASSVHPLTLVAGIKIAKKWKIPCICEVRDLWPETFVAYKIKSKSNVMVKLLYRLEKWIYRKSDSLIFTMEGASDYLYEWGLEDLISQNKIHYINNGIDLDEFYYNKEHYQIVDKDLNNLNIFKVVYTGSIRKVNNLGLLLDVAKIINNKKIKFLIWGDGDELEFLKERLIKENIKNVIFKGKVEKKYIPYIVSLADLNIIHNTPSPIFRFGISANKLFDYLAAGKPILADFSCRYNPIIEYSAGIEIENPTSEDIAEEIDKFSFMNTEEYERYCRNSLKASRNFDFKVLTEKVIDILENMNSK